VTGRRWQRHSRNSETKQFIQWPWTEAALCGLTVRNDGEYMNPVIAEVVSATLADADAKPVLDVEPVMQDVEDALTSSAVPEKTGIGTSLTSV